MATKQLQTRDGGVIQVQAEETTPRFPLLSLPDNVRRTIYEYVLEVGGPNIIRHRDFMAEPPRLREGSHHHCMLRLDQRIWPGTFTHALFTVNRQISHESLAVFYAHKTVDVEMAYEKLGKRDGYGNGTFKGSVDDLVKRKSRVRAINLCYDICLGQPPPGRHHRCFRELMRMVRRLVDSGQGYTPPKITLVLFLGYTQREWSHDYITRHMDFVVTELKPFKNDVRVELVDTSFLLSCGHEILERQAVDLFLGVADRLDVSFGYRVSSYQNELKRRGIIALWNAPNI